MALVSPPWLLSFWSRFGFMAPSGPTPFIITAAIVGGECFFVFGDTSSSDKRRRRFRSRRSRRRNQNAFLLELD